MPSPTAPSELDSGMPVVSGLVGPARTLGSWLVGRLPARKGTTEAGAGAADDVLSERHDALLEIARRLTETLDRREIFRLIVEETNRALRADGTVIRLLRDDRLELAAWAGIDDATAAALPEFRRHEGWLAEVLRTERPFVRDDLRRAGMLGYGTATGDTRA